MTHLPESIDLARNAIPCSLCFANGHVQRAGIAMPQPFTIGHEYRPGGTAVLSINPGASRDGGYKEARLLALTRFSAGDDAALVDYWSALERDAKSFWNPRYLLRLRTLNLNLPELAVGNIALCATEHNKYPGWMLRQCWMKHSSKMLDVLQPGTVVLMGSKSVMSRFELALSQTVSRPRVIRMAHFAHREGHAFEATECARIREFLTVNP